MLKDTHSVPRQSVGLAAVQPTWIWDREQQLLSLLWWTQVETVHLMLLLQVMSDTSIQVMVSVCPAERELFFLFVPLGQNTGNEAAGKAASAPLLDVEITNDGKNHRADEIND